MPMPMSVKLMVAYRGGLVVCDSHNVLWYGEPDNDGCWVWSLIEMAH